MSSSHSYKVYRRECEDSKKFSCYYIYIWFSFALPSSGYVDSMVYCTREAAGRLLPRWSTNQVKLPVLACFSIPSHFSACLELLVENCSFGD